MKLKHKTPCAECPWRRSSAPGWLGGHAAEFYADGPRHSPTGFAHGYGGSGPAELAYSMIRYTTGRKPTPGLYQSFKRSVISNLDQDKGWAMTGAIILEFITDYVLYNRDAEVWEGTT